MDIRLDIPYTQPPVRSPLHEFDLYLPPGQASNSSRRALICFVHGGAWRSEDKKDHATLAEKIALHTDYPVAVPNYRLTPQQEPADSPVRHPSHAEDILQFLEFLLTWGGPSGLGHIYDPKKLILMGHSCGAHMLSSIFLDSSKVTPTLTPSLALLHAIRGVVMSEGIYDLDMLNRRFPSYLDWFIAPAFGRLESYARFSVTGYGSRDSGINWLIIHSQGDTLVDLPQSEKMLQHLKSEYGKSADGHIFYDSSLSLEHDDILATDEFVGIIGRFVEGLST